MAEPSAAARPPRPPGTRPLLARLLVLAAAVLLPAIPSPARAARNDITIKGSDTMVILMRRWAQAYSELHPRLSIQVTGGGTGTGLAALVNRTTDICMASRPIRPDETEAAIKVFRRRPAAYPVALDALAVFVHDTNPVRALSLPQLAALFTGEHGNWRDVGGPDAPVILYSRENSSGTYEFFKEHVLGGRDFSARTQTMPGTAAVLAAVSRDPRGIGYGGVAFDKGARLLALHAGPDHPAVLPDEPSVTQGRYPIGRHLILYVNPSLDHGDTAAFIRWIQSDAGQALVPQVGYFPLPPTRRPPG